MNTITEESGRFVLRHYSHGRFVERDCPTRAAAEQAAREEHEVERAFRVECDRMEGP